MGSLGIVAGNKQSPYSQDDLNYYKAQADMSFNVLLESECERDKIAVSESNYVLYTDDFKTRAGIWALKNNHSISALILSIQVVLPVPLLLFRER